MARSRTSSAWLFLWGGMLLATFRPIAPLERALDVALAPLRWLAELGTPLALIRARSAAAAERELARAAATEAAEGADVLARLAERARPKDDALRVERDFVAVDVIGRPVQDQCWVLLREAARVQRGAPVVCGDAYVGRVVEVRPDAPTLARVLLVTERGFRVGAEVEAEGAPGQEPVFLTVGGVRAPRRGDPRSVRLLVHQPSSNVLTRGVVRVHELFADADDSAGLAEGFRLGQLRRAGERDDYWIEPELDYLDGLFHLAIAIPPEARDRSGTAPVEGLEDGQWLATRALTFGDPAPWRSTRKIPLGRSSGVEIGAAVSGTGARLVGRVLRTGFATSDVALLDDPGFTVTAIARLEGRSEPLILGRLSTIGREANGAIRMRWWVRVAHEVGEGSGRARLFSGSGDAGLPGGLFLGATRLPSVARPGEELELLLEPGVDPADVRTLFVRREARGRP